MAIFRCRGCNRGMNRHHRLCWKCSDDPAARAAHLSGDRREPTMEELELLIAERMKCLPPWWEAERRKMRVNEVDL